MESINDRNTLAGEDIEHVDGPPYWQERGWKIKEEDSRRTIYEGKYKATNQKGNLRNFLGYIIYSKPIESEIIGTKIQRQPEAEVFVINPPQEIKNHPHGHCFQFVSALTRKKALFKLHFERPPRDVDAAILFMDNLLNEALNHTKLSDNK